MNKKTLLLRVIGDWDLFEYDFPNLKERKQLCEKFYYKFTDENNFLSFDDYTVYFEYINSIVLECIFNDILDILEYGSNDEPNVYWIGVDHAHSFITS